MLRLFDNSLVLPPDELILVESETHLLLYEFFFNKLFIIITFFIIYIFWLCKNNLITLYYVIPPFKTIKWKKILALIGIRSGSKSLKNKNLKKLGVKHYYKVC